MDTFKTCKSCKKKRVIRDEESGNLVCASCGVEQPFDNFQFSFGGLDGPQGNFIRIGTSAPTFNTTINGQKLYIRSDNVSSIDAKIYRAKNLIEEVTSKLRFSPARTSQVKKMIEEVTEGEFGQGNWFDILVGAASYVVIRKNTIPVSMAEVAALIGYDVYELGKMVIRVVDFLNLDDLPKFDIVSAFERAIRNCSSFGGICSEKRDKMVKQGRFLLQCGVKWFLTTGRQPNPMVVAVLVFVAELNQVEVSIGVVAKELHAGVCTTKKRYKELKESLVKVAQVLPWGKDVTVKNILKNAPLVIQYMEMESRLTPGKKRKASESFGFDLEDLVDACLSKEIEYAEFATEDSNQENDSQYFEREAANGIPSDNFDDLDNIKISQDSLSRIYAKFSDENGLLKSMDERGEGAHKRKRKKGCGNTVDNEWWTGKSDMSKKLSFKEILEKDVGLNALPPSFIAGELACKRRREKIHAAKLRIHNIMHPQNIVSDGKKEENCSGLVPSSVDGGKNVEASIMDWEDTIIESLLLRQVREEEIEQGHYKRLLALYVCDSESTCNIAEHKKHRE